MIVVSAKPKAGRRLPGRSLIGRRLRRYALPTFGGGIVLFWIVVAVWATEIVPYDPLHIDVVHHYIPPGGRHWLGTDELGRDVLSRLILGSRISLLSGFAVALLGGAFGVLLGAVAAYAHGWVDEGIMRLTDLVLCFPPIILAMAIAAALGIGVLNTLVAILIVWWPKYARVSRSLVIGQRSLDYVAAGRVVGLGPARILFRHIMPNAIGPLLVLVTLDIGNAIITFAGLNFLGLGVVPPTPEWGAMVSEGRGLLQYWWIATFPGLAILTIVLGSNFVGDGLRDLLDPKARLR
jgi:peptide/nickel transport system permease protein